MITPLTEGYIAVTLPTDADNIELHDEPEYSNDVEPYITYHTGMGADNYDILRETLPPGQWQFIGRGSELTNEQWEPMVGRLIDNAVAFYTNYFNIEYFFDTATESGLSLLQSLSIDPGCVILKKIK